MKTTLFYTLVLYIPLTGRLNTTGGAKFRGARGADWVYPCLGRSFLKSMDSTTHVDDDALPHCNSRGWQVLCVLSGSVAKSLCYLIPSAGCFIVYPASICY